ncbi:hypothetical protein KIL84_015965 [Mauremys mutica]|uniref:Uncharacterized protein n=1 Tax=Mauremys mutica TaxID=74926 RepID=A0A9D3WT12_9SAUR|nr:hypothetical protein KIL84_015965 [Mauremys mutica]
MRRGSLQSRHLQRAQRHQNPQLPEKPWKLLQRRSKSSNSRCLNAPDQGDDGGKFSCSNSLSVPGKTKQIRLKCKIHKEMLYSIGSRSKILEPSTGRGLRDKMSKSFTDFLVLHDGKMEVEATSSGLGCT